jgi:hypothetical protein
MASRSFCFGQQGGPGRLSDFATKMAFPPLRMLAFAAHSMRTVEADIWRKPGRQFVLSL